MPRATLYSDGGARGNPGPAGIGFVLQVEGQSPITVSRYLGEATNNQAEYAALIAGLERALAESVDEVECFLDSELVTRQLQGLYRVKDQKLKPLFEAVSSLRRRFKSIEFQHVLREKNQPADALVNHAIDEASKKPLA